MHLRNHLTVAFPLYWLHLYQCKAISTINSFKQPELVLELKLGQPVRRMENIVSSHIRLEDLAIRMLYA